MGQTTLYASGSAIVKYSNKDGNFSGDATVTMDILDELLLQFQPPDALRFREITGLSVYIYAATSGTASLGIRGLYSVFDQNSVTYNTKPSSDAYAQANISIYADTSPGYSGDKYSTDSAWVRSIKNGVSARGSSSAQLATSRNATKPYLVVTHADANSGIKLSNLSPSKGSIVAANANKFAWSESSTNYTIQSISRTSAKFRWRKSASDTVKEIAVSGTATSITIPANTFSGDSIQWQITVTANSGVTTTSDWMTISLEDVASTAVAVAPDRAVLDGDSDNVFRWEHVISTGTPQSKAELQQSTDGTTWTALATVTGTGTTWTAPAGTFASGTKYWRVRTYNSKGVAGAWSSATQFIVLAAPPAPPVAIVSTEPRPEIRWQSDEQQAYQVEIDGIYTSGTRFGTGKTWKAPFYLADGNYTVRVRVQNEYGFWSPWGVAALPVTNVPGGAITLTADGGIDAALSWAAGSFDYYLVYRDGVAIAKVEEPGYTDAASIGTVTYQVRGCYTDGDNYSLSNAVEVTVATDRVRLYDMEAAAWLEPLYDSSAHRSTGLTLTQDIQYVQLSGHVFPVAERSEFQSRALRITCVCADETERRALRALLGHLTCCKTPEGNMVIGYPASISESSDDFFSTYSFTLEQIDRKEEISLDT